MEGREKKSRRKRESMRIEPKRNTGDKQKRKREEDKEIEEMNERSLKIVINVYLKDKGRTCSRSNNQ